jgi:hypothetical protein
MIRTRQLRNLYYETINADRESGFAHVLLTDGLCIQCCLIQRKDGGYRMAVNQKDSHINDDICLDVNNQAFHKYGREVCQQFLFSELRKIGVKLL